MKINSKTFLKELLFAKGAIGKKSVNQMFGCFYIHTHGDKVKIVGSCGEIVNVSYGDMEEPSDDTKFCVDAYTLIDIINVLDGTIELTLTETQLIIENNGGTYKIPLFDIKDYPQINLATEHLLLTEQYDVVRTALSVANTSVEIDDFKPAMSGVFIDSSNGYVVGANMNELSIIKTDIKSEESIFIKKEHIPRINSLDGSQITISKGTLYTQFKCENRYVYIQNNDVEYMNYTQVLKTPSDICGVDSLELVRKLQRLMAIHKEENYIINISFGEQITLTLESSLYNMYGKEVLDVKCNKQIDVKFNIKNLINLVNSRECATLHLLLDGYNTPLYITGDDNITNILMPLV